MEARYDRYADLLYRLALANLQNETDAEDVVHDVFLKCFEKSPHFHDEEHEKAWFIRVTVNACRDYLRKRKHRDHVPLEEIHHVTGVESSKIAVLEHVSEISERYRTAIVLHYLEGYSINEISQILRVSPSAVKMRLSRGRELLKERIEKEENHV